MGTFKEHIKQVLDTYNCKQKNNYLVCLPVYENEKIIAYLRPITADYLNTIPNIVEFMTRWRIENPTLATGTFTVTYERTQKWLENIVVNNDNRIIFLVQNFNSEYLGHIGFAAFDENNESAEIDSVLRGAKNIIPGLMERCMEAMIPWGYDVLKLKHIHLEVFFDNTHAVNFYKRCGFKEDKLIPLVEKILPDEKKWERDPNPDNKNAAKYFLNMVYER